MHFYRRWWLLSLMHALLGGSNCCQEISRTAERSGIRARHKTLKLTYAELNAVNPHDVMKSLNKGGSQSRGIKTLKLRVVSFFSFQLTETWKPTRNQLILDWCMAFLWIKISSSPGKHPKQKRNDPNTDMILPSWFTEISLILSNPIDNKSQYSFHNQ